MGDANRRDTLIGTGVLAILLTWLIRQLIEGVSGAVKEASTQATERTNSSARTLTTALIEANTKAFEVMGRAFQTAVNPPVVTYQGDPPGVSEPLPDNWWDQPGFDPSAYGIDPSDTLIHEGDMEHREGTASIPAGVDFMSQVIGAKPLATGLPGAPLPNLAGEMLGVDDA